MVKLPSKSVAVPFVVPFSITVAPIKGSPVESSTTPWTSIFWAKAGSVNDNSKANATSAFRLRVKQTFFMQDFFKFYIYLKLISGSG